MAAALTPIATVGGVGNIDLQSATLNDPTTNSSSSVVTTGASCWANVSGFSRHSLYVSNGATTSVIFTCEGSLDGTNFETISYRLLSSGVYAESAVTVTGSSKDVLHFSPTEYFRFMRVNVSTANTTNGTVFTLYSET